jgi:Na+-translocating ferredoxin:NAD+ oxidoreductase RnfD subunit
MRFTKGGSVLILSGLAIGCGIAWWSDQPLSDPIAAMTVAALMFMPFFIAADLLTWVRGRRRKLRNAARDQVTPEKSAR